MLSFSSGKSLLCTPSPNPGMLLGRCWHKNYSFRMSFLAWHVLHGTLPMTDALARLGFHVLSWFCTDLLQETITHIFYAGTTVEVVWQFFTESLGLRLWHCGLRSLLSSWRRGVSCNKLLAFVVWRLPYAILWELWKHKNGCLRRVSLGSCMA